MRIKYRCFKCRMFCDSPTSFCDLVPCSWCSWTRSWHCWVAALRSRKSFIYAPADCGTFHPVSSSHLSGCTGSCTEVYVRKPSVHVNYDSKGGPSCDGVRMPMEYGTVQYGGSGSIEQLYNLGGKGCSLAGTVLVTTVHTTVLVRSGHSGTQQPRAVSTVQCVQ